MDKIFSKRRNRVSFLLVVYLPFVLPSITMLVNIHGFQYVDWVNTLSQYLFGTWYMFILPISTMLGLIMIVTGWYKEIRKITHDTSYRWLGSVTVLLNIIIYVSFAATSS